MIDPFAQRADTLHNALLHMERDAAEDDLFALGYMIPQIELVVDMAEYDPATVDAEDFDVTYWQWLETAFAEDAMNDEDRLRIKQLWTRACRTT